MNQDRFTAVDNYLEALFVGEDAALDHALRATTGAGMPEINVTATQGQFLALLVRMIQAQRVLEIGTLGGFSTIWLARALPANGALLSLELEPKHAAVARANLENAGLADRVEVRVGPALESLQQLAAAQVEPFDFIFIDADKEGYVDYLDWSLRLARSGSVIVADNVIRQGAVVDASSGSATVQAVRRFNATLAADSRVHATVLQLVGSKGYDGMALAVVR